MFKSGRRKSAEDTNRQIVTICPLTKKDVVGEVWDRVDQSDHHFPGKHVVWWYCHYCQNWHAAFEEISPT